jgi:hypothetical protein
MEKGELNIGGNRCDIKIHNRDSSMLDVKFVVKPNQLEFFGANIILQFQDSYDLPCG